MTWERGTLIHDTSRDFIPSWSTSNRRICLCSSCGRHQPPITQKAQQIFWALLFLLSSFGFCKVKLMFFVSSCFAGLAKFCLSLPALKKAWNWCDPSWEMFSVSWCQTFCVNEYTAEATNLSAIHKAYLHQSEREAQMCDQFPRHRFISVGELSSPGASKPHKMASVLIGLNKEINVVLSPITSLRWMWSWISIALTNNGDIKQNCHFDGISKFRKMNLFKRLDRENATGPLQFWNFFVASHITKYRIALHGSQTAWSASPRGSFWRKPEQQQRMPDKRRSCQKSNLRSMA